MGSQKQICHIMLMYKQGQDACLLQTRNIFTCCYHYLSLKCLNYFQVGGDNDGERDDEAEEVDEEDKGHVHLLVLPRPIPLHPTTYTEKNGQEFIFSNLLPDFETVEVEGSPAQQRRAADHEGVGPDEEEGTEGGEGAGQGELLVAGHHHVALH